jgi:hypothetical protein
MGQLIASPDIYRATLCGPSGTLYWQSNDQIECDKDSEFGTNNNEGE